METSFSQAVLLFKQLVAARGDTYFLTLIQCKLDKKTNLAVLWIPHVKQVQAVFKCNCTSWVSCTKEMLKKKEKSESDLYSYLLIVDV